MTVEFYAVIMAFISGLGVGWVLGSYRNVGGYQSIKSIKNAKPPEDE